jgi:hypothetical protein
MCPLTAGRLIGDEQGEPIVVAAKAMAVPADVLQRILLFLNPHIGQSVDRVYELASLYNEISVKAAQRLVSIWRDADPAGEPATKPTAMDWRHTVESARRALSEISRPTAKRDALVFRRDRR